MVVWYTGTSVSEKPATIIFRVTPYPMAGGNSILQNVGTYPLNCTVSHPSLL